MAKGAAMAANYMYMSLLWQVILLSLVIFSSFLMAATASSALAADKSMCEPKPVVLVKTIKCATTLLRVRMAQHLPETMNYAQISK
jgi:hypothetical protein